MRRFRSAVVASVAALLVGCTSTTVGTPSPAVEPVVPAPPELVAQQLSRTDTGPGGVTCTYDLTWVRVANVRAAAATLMDATLDPAPGPSECTDAVTVTGGFVGEPATNERGVLSLVYRTLRTSPGAAYPLSTVQTFTFDVTTGVQLILDEVLTARGRTAFVAACRAGLDPQLAQAGDYCGDALGSGPFAAFTVVPDGLVAQPFNEVPNVAQELVVGGVLVPWQQLGDGGLVPGTPVALLAG